MEYKWYNSTYDVTAFILPMFIQPFPHPARAQTDSMGQHDWNVHSRSEMIEDQKLCCRQTANNLVGTMRQSMAADKKYIFFIVFLTIPIWI